MNQFDSRDSWQGCGQRSIEERRRVLRSLGVGSAVVGAPALATAAAPGSHCKSKLDNKKYKPTASAVGSVLASVATTKPPMYGHSCSDYRNSSYWGTGWTNGKGRPLTYDLCAKDPATGTRFYEAFNLPNPYAGSKFRRCADILRNYPTSDEAIWLTALCNANKLAAASLFPYEPAGVLALYVNQNPLMGNFSDSSLHAKAKTLFRDYLSQGPV
jgi:hypothetical protein